MPPGDAAQVELREQALIGGAALAALAQALTSLVGGSWFTQVVFFVPKAPGVGPNKNKPPKDGRKKQLLVKGSIKMRR